MNDNHIECATAKHMFANLTYFTSQLRTYTDFNCKPAK